MACGSRGAGATVSAERAAARPLRPRPRRRRRPRRGRAPLRRAGHGAARRARRRRHRPRRVARAAERARRQRRRRRPLGRSSRSSSPPTGCCPPRWWPPSPSSSSPPCAAPAPSPTAARRWGSPAPSRTSAASTRSPTIPSAASRTSWSWRPSTRSLLAERLEHQEASVQRFLELSDPLTPPELAEPATVRADAPPLGHRLDRRRGRRVPGHRDAAHPSASTSATPRTRPSPASSRPRPAATPAEVISLITGCAGQRRVPGACHRQRRPRSRHPGERLDRRDQPVVDVLGRLHPRHRAGGLGGGRTRYRACSACASATRAACFRASRSSCWSSAGGSASDADCPSHF